MHLLSINFYELGQFLQILLWISLPMVIIVLLVTTYLHYRKKRRREQEDDYVDIAGGPVEISLENTGNAYRGLLWMKDKYEQYRDQTDNKLERLKGELARSEQKYLGLLAEQGEQKSSLLPVPSRTTILQQKTLAEDSLRTEPAAAAEQSLSDELSLSPAGQLEKSAPPPGSTSGESIREELSLQHDDSQEGSLPIQEPILGQNDPREGSSPAPDNLKDSHDRESTREELALRDLVADKDRQIGFLHVELDQRIKNYHELDYQHRDEKTRAEELAGQYLQAQQQLEAQQLKIDELNERLGYEMSKAGDLTGKLENNMRLLLHIHQELDKSLHAQQPDNSLPAQNELTSYEGATPAEENKEDNSESLPLPKQSHEPGRDQFLSLTENTKIVGWIESEDAGIKLP